jgi:hypothetical protein
MAFEKSLELDNGFTGNYWRLSSVHVNCDANLMVSINMYLYKNRDARVQGKTPIFDSLIQIPLTSIDSTFSYDFRACIYNSLKQLEYWSDAVDIIESDGS